MNFDHVLKIEEIRFFPHKYYSGIYARYSGESHFEALHDKEFIYWISAHAKNADFPEWFIHELKAANLFYKEFVITGRKNPAVLETIQIMAQKITDDFKKLKPDFAHYVADPAPCSPDQLERDALGILWSVEFFPDYEATGVWLTIIDNEEMTFDYPGHVCCDVETLERYCRILIPQQLKNKIDAMQAAFNHFADYDMGKGDSFGKDFPEEIMEMYDYMSFVIGEEFKKLFPEHAHLVRYRALHKVKKEVNNSSEVVE